MTVHFGTFAPQGWRMDLDDIADPVEKFNAMIRVAQVADEGGWDSVWLYDHFHTTPVATMEATFECWTSTTAIARATKNVNVGQMVGCNGYRNPALYAKIASTVDVASNGRLYAGLGAGWYEQEWKAYGYEWPELKVRMGQFREAAENRPSDVGPRISRSFTASTTTSTSRSTSRKGCGSRTSPSGSVAVASR